MDSDITSYVINSIEHAMQKTLNKSTGTRLRTWHVSDFVSPCMRKVRFSRLYPEEFDQKKRAVLFAGVVIHEHTKLSHFNEMTMCYDIENDRSLTPQTVATLPRDDTLGIITGTLDDLIRVNDDFVIVDKKTFSGKGFKKTEPNEEHVKQLDIYRVLLRESYGIDAKYGCIVYLDKSNDLDMTVLPFELTDVGTTKKFMRDILAQLNSPLMPKATITWLCNMKNREKKCYCPFLTQCEREGRTTDIPPV